MSSAFKPEVLEALSSAKSNNDWSLLLHWLRERGKVDPQTEQIIQTLINNQSPQPTEEVDLEIEPVEDDDEEGERDLEVAVEGSSSSTTRQKRVVGRIRKILVRMSRELAYYREANETLAEALGACFCWGEDPACEACKGQGQPGFNPPVAELYERWVSPACRRMTEQKTIKQNPERKS